MEITNVQENKKITETDFKPIFHIITISIYLEV